MVYPLEDMERLITYAEWDPTHRLFMDRFERLSLTLWLGSVDETDHRQQLRCNTGRTFFHGVIAMDGKVKDGLEKAREQLLRIERLEYRLGTDSRYVHEDSQLTEACETAGHGYQDLYTGWDIMAQLAWSFYLVDIPFREARFPLIAANISEYPGMEDWLGQIGIVFGSDGTPTPRHGGVLQRIQQFRNQYAHTVVGSRYIPAGDDYFQPESYSMWDHHREKEVQIATPLVRHIFGHLADGYEHYRVAWTGMMKILNDHVNEHGLPPLES